MRRKRAGRCAACAARDRAASGMPPVRDDRCRRSRRRCGCRGCRRPPLSQVRSRSRHRHLVEDHRRQRPRLQRDHLGDHDAFDRAGTRLGGVAPDRRSRRCTAAGGRHRPGPPAAPPCRARSAAWPVPSPSSSRHCVQLTKQPVGAVPQRKGRAKRPPGEGPGDRAHVVGGGRRLRRPGQPALVGSAAACSPRSCWCRSSTGRRRGRAPRTGAPGPASGRSAMLRGRVNWMSVAVGAGRVAARAIQQLQVGAVGFASCTGGSSCPGARSQRLNTTRPSCSTVGSRSWLWLKEIWWMSVPSAFITCSTKARSLRFRSAPRTAACPRRAGWPSTGAGASRRTRCGRPAGSAARRRGLPGRGVRGDHAAQLLGREVVFPDVPGRRSSARPLDHPAAHARRRACLPSDETSTSLMSPVPLRDAVGDVALGRRGRGAVAQEQVRIRLGVAQLAHVGRQRPAGRDGALDVGDREVERARVGGLAAAGGARRCRRCWSGGEDGAREQPERRLPEREPPISAGVCRSTHLLSPRRVQACGRREDVFSHKSRRRVTFGLALCDGALTNVNLALRRRARGHRFRRQGGSGSRGRG